MQNQNEIRRLMDLNLDELREDLGRQIASNLKLSMPLSYNRLVELSNNWINEQRKNLASYICSDQEVRSLSGSPSTERRIMLASAIADLISSILVGISPITVAVLIVKEGIETFCKDEKGSLN